MEDELRCLECGIRPPETESAYTLIGGKAGWRLTRTRAADGSVLTQWRCADCWAKFKKTAAPAAAPAAGGRTAAPPVGGGKPRPRGGV